MAQLTIITETGMFHSACRCSWGGAVSWYGFKPIAHRSPVGMGFVDVSDRSAQMNYNIAFTIDDTALSLAVEKVKRGYTEKEYILAVRDCVSFSADVAREVGLRVPPLNFTPYGFIKILAVWNDYTSAVF